MSARAVVAGRACAIRLRGVVSSCALDRSVLQERPAKGVGNFARSLTCLALKINKYTRIGATLRTLSAVRNEASSQDTCKGIVKMVVLSILQLSYSARQQPSATAREVRKGSQRKLKGACTDNIRCCLHVVDSGFMSGELSILPRKHHDYDGDKRRPTAPWDGRR